MEAALEDVEEGREELAGVEERNAEEEEGEREGNEGVKDAGTN